MIQVVIEYTEDNESLIAHGMIQTLVDSLPAMSFQFTVTHVEVPKLYRYGKEVKDE